MLLIVLAVILPHFDERAVHRLIITVQSRLLMGTVFQISREI
jgi:hypothetical protein